ncbi:RNA polymerase factor sigma-54 [uncultured Cetobacterium sp.]|uniref:RNA polymerase factor sigma-54 n=1 Tax=uncultured Cetobacterium sp. TaxID=527638 RepID=UPI002609FE2F|nr:RNA polymerase factor sigma-54 [uncultured Cetobacterium sp.]
MDFRLDLSQNLKLAMTTEMKLSIKILKMSSIELKEFVEKEAIKNPAIEIVYSNKNYSKNKESENFLENITSEEESLIDYLEEQIGYLKIEKDIREAMVYLINNLDERGYILGDLNSLRKSSKIKVDVFNIAFKNLRKLDPLGVGAVDLKDCLKIQILEKKIEKSNIFSIIDEDLEDVASGNLNKISLKYSISLEDVKKEISIIRGLNPKPARGYYVNDNTKYVVPDFLVEIIEKNIVIKPNEDYLPKIKLNEKFKGTPNFSFAIAIEKSVVKRQQTLLNIVSYIMEYQKESVVENKELKTLKIKDIAFELNLHESTVSRAIKDKYIKIDTKIISLKKYIILNSGTEIIKKKIIEIVEKENIKSPFSDEKIAKILEGENFYIQRRTIAKYREELGILSSRKRKSR